MAVKVFHIGESGTAVLVTAQGIGAVTMALTLGGARRALRAPPGAADGAQRSPGRARAVRARADVAALGRRDLLRRSLLPRLRSRASRRSRSCARRRELRGRVLSVAHGAPRLALPDRRILQGAVADEIGLRATTVGTAVLLAVRARGDPSVATGLRPSPRRRRRRDRHDRDRGGRRRGGRRDRRGQTWVACRRSTDGNGERGGSCGDGPRARTARPYRAPDAQPPRGAQRDQPRGPPR